jgi:hypothetical protein
MVRDGPGLPVVLIAAIPIVAVRLGMGFLRYQARRKQGVQSFRETLVRSGMPREQADRLAQSYHEAGSPTNVLRSAGAT